MQITANFSIEEFDCKCGCKMPYQVLLNITKLAIQLQIIRDVYSSTITINSGYRCTSHNNKIGGKFNSRHLIGKAADFVVKDLNPKDVQEALEMLIIQGIILQGGLGYYNTFTHYDIRRNRARWSHRK